MLGWTDKTCSGGVDIFRKNESYLISLIGDTKENCQALCDALPECSLAKFHSGSRRKIYKCIPKAKFEGACKDNSFRYLYSPNFYVKKKNIKRGCYSDTPEQTLQSIQGCLALSENNTLPHPEQTELLGATNVATKWKWNALDNGTTNDCRLCVPTRSEKVWNSCQHDCKDIPNELKDMELVMKLTQSTRIAGGSDWFSYNKYGRERLLKMMKSSPSLLKLYTNDIPDFQDRMRKSMNTGIH